MPKYRLDWKYWSDGKASVRVTHIETDKIVAVHTGKREYLWSLIEKRGYNC